MSAIELKRCRHCVNTLVAVQIDPREDFTLSGPAVVCERCDADAHGQEPLFVPDWWE
jgi:hypothetical protein